MKKYTGNAFKLAPMPGGVRVGRLPPSILPAAGAVNLAAWLVACVEALEPEAAKRFRDELAAARKSLKGG